MKEMFQKKNILIFFITLLLGIIIGFFLVKYIEKTNKTDCLPPTHIINKITLTDLNINSELYEGVSLNKQSILISNKNELENTLNTYTEDNIQNSNSLKKIRENYNNFDFSNKQLLFVDISTSSGCEYLKILNIILNQPYINIEFEPEKQYETLCQVVLKGIRIVEIEKGNYTKIKIN